MSNCLASSPAVDRSTSTPMRAITLATLVSTAAAVMFAAAPASAAPATVERSSVTSVAGKDAGPGYEALAAFERDMRVLDRMSDAEVQALVRDALAGRTAPANLASSSTMETTQGIPLPGPWAIVQCLAATAWEFRDGNFSRTTIVGKIANIVMGCVGIPFFFRGAVMKIIWENRQRIAAGIAAFSLFASQALLAAPRP